jgi:hypothetical protein
MKKLFVIAALCSAQSVCAQDDLLGMVDEPVEEKAKRVFATFKTTHIGNAQSVETVKKSTSISGSVTVSEMYTTTSWASMKPSKRFLVSII